MATKVGLVIIGDELLSGAVHDANSYWLSRKLTAIGLDVLEIDVVPDRIDKILSAYARAFRSSQLVISCGGLGPTDDDLTRQAAATFFDRKLEIDTQLLNHLRSRFKKLGRKLSVQGERQALIPQGAELLRNTLGAAPGIVLTDNQKNLILLPGVPSEVQTIAKNELIPYLEKKYPGDFPGSVLFRTASTVETELAMRIKPFLINNPEAKVSYLPLAGRVDLRITPGSSSNIDSILDNMTGILGDDLYATEELELSQVVGKKLVELGKTLSVAESCTGGMLSSTIVSNPGSSRYFQGGVTTYSDMSKHDLLGVSQNLLSEHGAVSSAVAKAMAQGSRQRFETDYSLSTTGIAGPDGGSEVKPVGLVYIGLAIPETVRSFKFVLPGDRQKIRERTVVMALDLMRRHLTRTK